MMLLLFLLERMRVNDMNRFEESIEIISDYHEQILEYINDVHEENDFTDGYEFNERYIEVERMIINKEID